MSLITEELTPRQTKFKKPDKKITYQTFSDEKIRTDKLQTWNIRYILKKQTFLTTKPRVKQEVKDSK